MKKNITIRFNTSKGGGFSAALAWIGAVITGLLVTIGIFFLLCLTAVFILIVAPMGLIHRLIYGMWPEWFILESKDDDNDDH